MQNKGCLPTWLTSGMSNTVGQTGKQLGHLTKPYFIRKKDLIFNILCGGFYYYSIDQARREMATSQHEMT